MLAAAALAALLAALLGAAPAAAQVPSFCDSSLIVPDDRLGYRYQQRGDFCEGRYAAPVSGSSLTIASLEDAGSATPAADGGTVELAWSDAGNTRLTLHVRSLKPRLFYRLDAAPPEPPFSWSAEVIDELGLTAADLGAVATADWSLAGLPVYVPVRFVAPGERRGYLRLVVVPEKRIDALYLTVATLNPEGEATPAPGRSSPLLRDGWEVGADFYAAGRQVEIELPTVSGVPRYRVEIGAALTGGGLAHREFVVFLPDA